MLFSPTFLQLYFVIATYHQHYDKNILKEMKTPTPCLRQLSVMKVVWHWKPWWQVVVNNAYILPYPYIVYKLYFLYIFSLLSNSFLFLVSRYINPLDFLLFPLLLTLPLTRPILVDMLLLLMPFWWFSLYSLNVFIFSFTNWSLLYSVLIAVLLSVMCDAFPFMYFYRKAILVLLATEKIKWEHKEITFSNLCFGDTAVMYVCRKSIHERSFQKKTNVLSLVAWNALIEWTLEWVWYYSWVTGVGAEQTIHTKT